MTSPHTVDLIAPKCDWCHRAEAPPLRAVRTGVGMSDKPCGCRDCPFPVCKGCNEDHGSCPGELCRDCYHDEIFRRIDEHEKAHPGSLEKRLAELVQMFDAKKART